MSKHCHDAHCSCHGHEHKHEHGHGHKHKHDRHGSCGCAHCEERLHGEAHFEKGKLVRLCIAAAWLIAAFFVPLEGSYTQVLRLGLYLVPYLIIGSDVLIGALGNVVRGKLFDEQFLMSIATVGAFVIGEYAEGVAVMLFYQLGELLQDAAVGKSRRSIAALMEIRPPFAVVLREGGEMTVSPEEVEVGECILVRPGERIPLDGRILDGETTVDNTALTGESLPVFCEVGDPVYSGSVNMAGVITVRVASHYHESTVARILELVEHAAEKKSRIEGFIARFSRCYTPIVVVCALLLALLPPLAFAQAWSEWVRRALVFLVVSCPCALVISVPLSFFGGIGAASRQGILIKGAGYLEQLSRVDTVVFDKTGTLSRGRFSLCEVCSPKVPKQELLSIAAGVERYSNHPIAQSVAKACHGRPLDVTDVIEMPGKGVSATAEGKRYFVGNAAFMTEQRIALPTVKGEGVIYVADGEGYLGHMILQDELKPEAEDALQALSEQGITQTVMLTGDRATVAQTVGTALGIDRVYAELLPQQKAERLEQLLAAGHRVAYVGDGINDAPVLARADVGIAMGAIGSDAAIESADIVLMDDDLSKLPHAVSLAKRTMRIVRQNIFFALFAKGIILLLGALGYANLWFAVFGDVGVMLIAILNAMRALLPPRC